LTTEKDKQRYSCCGPSSRENKKLTEEISQTACCEPTKTEQSVSLEEKAWNISDEGIRQAVREQYGRAAERNTSCCGSGAGRSVSEQMGYSKEELDSLPEGTDLGLGCGNPTAFASIQPGDVVVDLGSGAGIDCFLAAQKAGETGKVIGVDMTAQMIDKARANARQGGYANVEFRLGEIENMPIADNTADLIISNCVINLSPDKPQVFREAHRVLKPGGRLMVSDIVILRPLPDQIRNSVRAYTGCIGGAMLMEEYLDAVKSAGFEDVQIIDKRGDSEAALEEISIEETDLSQEELSKIIMKSVVSIQVSARKADN
jgi:ubiquinone/menaquinone biosynthesis C-methylase UbiE